MLLYIGENELTFALGEGEYQFLHVAFSASTEQDIKIQTWKGHLMRTGTQEKYPVWETSLACKHSDGQRQHGLLADKNSAWV